MAYLRPTAPLFSASALNGVRVVSPQDDDLGKIKEVMLDTRTAQISYIVLSFGGLRGVGAKLFPLPWPIFRFDFQIEQLELDVAKERLVKAPGFDKSHWHSTADPEWVSRIHSHDDILLY